MSSNEETRRCARLVENKRVRILENPRDPSWSENFAELQSTILDKRNLDACFRCHELFPQAEMFVGKSPWLDLVFPGQYPDHESAYCKPCYEYALEKAKQEVERVKQNDQDQ
jgi:hypothetical protein